ncbi:hypothetical protein BJ742DRAFT_809307 [Cladochytrium replicatum]|nr:hypothetical protein BJ742DRAFT_809307 [Cladochytrium replicatum]
MDHGSRKQRLVVTGTSPIITQRPRTPRKPWSSSSSASVKDHQMKKSSSTSSAATAVTGASSTTSSSGTLSTISRGVSELTQAIANMRSSDDIGEDECAQLQREVMELQRQTTEFLFKEHNLEHESPSDLAELALSARRMKKENPKPGSRRVKDSPFMKHPQGISGLRPCDRVDVLGMVQSGRFTLGGLAPHLPPHQQIMILKAREKRLLLERWRNTWEMVRPPRPRWYEMKGREFHNEAARCHQHITHPEMQQAEARCREFLLEVFKRETMHREWRGNDDWSMHH